MEIRDLNEFLRYLEKIHQRTTRVIQCIPPDQVNWTYRDGKFTFGDLVRHIATIERFMFAETIAGRPSRYAGCGPELAETFSQILVLRQKLHAESLEIFSQLTADDLLRKCTTPDGAEITVWKWLRAMVEHEIHHRAQIYLYLSLLGVTTPPLYGLTSEQVRDRSLA